MNNTNLKFLFLVHNNRHKKTVFNDCNCFFLVFLFILFIMSNQTVNADNKSVQGKADVEASKTSIATQTSNINNTEKDSKDYKALKTEVKGNIRSLFEKVNKNLPKEDFGKLPEGLSIVDGEGFRGIKIVKGFLEFRTYTWTDDSGLLENFKRCRQFGEEIVAAVNGSFYSERGVLGQVIQNGQIPQVRQFPARLSRCFVCSFKDSKNIQYWYLGETPLNSSELLRPHKKEMVWLNGDAGFLGSFDNLLGGGGWILRNRKDAHWDAVDRQFFRFRKEDQTSRKTVVAQDSERNLYFIVFEAGFSLHQVARMFVKNDIFKDIQDVIFLDGGSSSCIVLNGKYLVPPLYLVDKARFSCIQIVKPTLIW